ncbi:MAG: DapH/DapD/GlmU-related protein [Candidatus Omnitrophica bacterium]|nr:DapH/DapD/GlmU-related protein [Candidatus Omnitrophota bacterium]
MKSFLMTFAQLLFALLMYCMGTIFFGLALFPSIALVFKVWHASYQVALWIRFIALGLSLGAGFFLFGLSLVILIGLVRTILFLRLKEGRYPIFSWEAVKWACVSSLYLLINFTFIDFILLTPFANLLQRMLGAKLGKNVQINSKFVFDASLLEIGDNTVIGGGAVIIGHQVERGFLKLRKVRIGKNVTIGSNSIITPGCEIGDNAIVGAGAVLLKNTKIEPRGLWYGVPAEPARPHHSQEEVK